MAARFVALRDDDVRAGFDLGLRLLRLADQRRDEHVLGVTLVDDILRGHAERIHQQLDWVGERNVYLRRGVLRTPTEQPCRRGLAFRQLWNVELLHQARGKLPVLFRDHLLQFFLFEAFVRHGHDDVDAVGLAVHVFVDPLQFDLELLRRERDGAQDAHTARLADRRDDVPAMAEGEDRELQAEHVTDTCLHGVTPAPA